MQPLRRHRLVRTKISLMAFQKNISHYSCDPQGWLHGSHGKWHGYVVQCLTFPGITLSNKSVTKLQINQMWDHSKKNPTSDESFSLVKLHIFSFGPRKCSIFRKILDKSAVKLQNSAPKLIGRLIKVFVRQKKRLGPPQADFFRN